MTGRPVQRSADPDPSAPTERISLLYVSELKIRGGIGDNSKIIFQ